MASLTPRRVTTDGAEVELAGVDYQRYRRYWLRASWPSIRWPWLAVAYIAAYGADHHARRTTIGRLSL